MSQGLHLVKIKIMVKFQAFRREREKDGISGQFHSYEGARAGLGRSFLIPSRATRRVLGASSPRELRHVESSHVESS